MLQTGGPDSGDPGIAYFDLTSEYRQHEDWGVRLASTTAARLRSSLSDDVMQYVLNYPENKPLPEGPHFTYHHSREIFLGRQGRGPLYITWDTNLLIDYFTYGSSLWAGESLPELTGGNYGAEIEGLQLIISLWVIRDIRFILLPATINDAKRKLSADQKGNRVNAFSEFASALRLVSENGSDEIQLTRDGLLILPSSALKGATEDIPAGYDRLLVQGAVNSGAHVFLTGDRGILRNRSALRPFGLLLVSPLDLIELLFGYGYFFCLLDPRFAYWPIPDQMRVGHMIAALPTRSQPYLDRKS